MIKDPLEARQQTWDRLLEVFAATDWDEVIQGPAPITYFQGREMPEAPPADSPHIKAFIRHADGGNASLSNENGKQRFFNDAIMIIQCFGPMSRGDGLEVAIKIATICKRAFEGYATEGNVWFRRCRVQEEDPSGNWDQCNMFCTLTYDEVH